MPQRFLLKRQNTKAAKKFRVKVETPFLVRIAGVFKTQLILYIVKCNNQIGQVILKGGRRQQMNLPFAACCCLKVNTLTLNQNPLGCGVPQPRWYQQCPSDEACWACAPWLWASARAALGAQIRGIRPDAQLKEKTVLKWDWLNSCSLKMGPELASPQVLFLHLVKICILPKWLYVKPN